MFKEQKTQLRVLWKTNPWMCGKPVFRFTQKL